MEQTMYVLMLPFSDQEKAEEAWELLTAIGFGVVGVTMRREVIPANVQEAIENVL